MDILLVEDNEGVIKGLKYSLNQNNYNCTSLKTVLESKEYLKENKPDLIILDISLPDGNGIELFDNTISKLDIPVIFLTASLDEETIVKCLNNGAYDYITKPFRTKELLARINKVLRIKNKNTIIKVKNVKFDIDKMEVYVSNKKIELTSLELKILYLLFTNLNKVVRRGYIIDKIWEWTGNDVNDNTVTVYLKRIREKLNEDIIITIKGIGYRIDEDEK